MEGPALNWRKSSFSGGNGGQCVEIASTVGAVLVRDTTDRDGGTLMFSVGSWRGFVTRLG